MRRQRLALKAVITVAALALTSPVAGAHSPKKGIGILFRPDPSLTVAILKKLNVHWFYTWGNLRPVAAPAKLPFVPMIWGCYPKQLPSAIQGLVKYRRTGIASAMLGFNEPDNHRQSNVPVTKALNAWPQLEAAGLPLGSPACVNDLDKWMRTFMRVADHRHYRVNFVCVHWYGAPNPKGFLKMLARVHHLYHRPIWVTEFAVSDWSIKKNHGINKYSPHMIARFMRVVLPALNHLSYVQRYAWFPAPLSDKTPTGNSALYHKNGKLTLLGRIYSAD